MKPFAPRRSHLDQRTLEFNPLKATPEQSERLRHLARQWTLEAAAEEFGRLPREMLDTRS